MTTPEPGVGHPAAAPAPPPHAGPPLPPYAAPSAPSAPTPRNGASASPGLVVAVVCVAVMALVPAAYGPLFRLSLNIGMSGYAVGVLVLAAVSLLFAVGAVIFGWRAFRASGRRSLLAAACIGVGAFVAVTVIVDQLVNFGRLVFGGMF